MRARVKVKAPWWTSLQGSERHATLEKTKDDGHGGVGLGDTRYAVFIRETQIGYVYSVKDEKTTRWYADGDDPEGSGHADRFTAIRLLINRHTPSALSA